ncbi:universal stress protein [Streptococcus plurextorum]|uniref:universal stress protein n=1 Tax=Streptococcus plurextorum TaxID=456876 RepID=UPI0003F92134|nr:universal stress protein [Streptococcus plurextorum]
MTKQAYHHILVGIDGSSQAERAFEKGCAVAMRNEAVLVLAHIIDIRTLQNVAALDTFVFETLEKDAREMLEAYKREAIDKGVKEVKVVLEFGSPKNLLAIDIPEQENIDLILLGATGLNTFERLLLGSSSEYIMRHAKVDILIVRDENKTL